MARIEDFLRRALGRKKISFPTDEAPKPEYKVPEPVQYLRPENDSRPSVLLVDDERVIVDTYAMILDQSGFYPLKAYSGEQALELIEKVRPDVVFSDIVMGWVNGVEVAVAVKQRWPDCPILLTTCAYGNLVLLEPAEAAGYHFEVVGRPVHPNDLLAKIRAMVGAPS